MNTERVYDMPTWLMVVSVLAACVAWVLAINSPSWAMFRSDITGAWFVTAIATGFACWVLHKWVYGTKLE